MKRIALIAALSLAFPAVAQEAEPVTPGSVVAAAAPEEWVVIAPGDLLVMDLAPDAAGRARRVVIQLMPPPFSQPCVENIRTLARAHWWDGTSVYRVVDNFVAQWGGGEDDNAGFAPHPLPEGVASPVAGPGDSIGWLNPPEVGLYTSAVDAALLPETWGSGGKRDFSETYYGSGSTDRSLQLADPYSNAYGFVGGMPVALGIPNGIQFRVAPRQPMVGWPIHCYAHVGVARDLAPDTGTGAELYAVIGHAPRALDRNIAVIGRVIEGIEHLSTLPRGTGDAGVYATRAEDTPIVSARLASELPEPPAFEYLSSDSDSFARYVASRANRQDAFYTVPAGRVDICNVQVPIRRAAG